jgi:hypothetical protein
MELDVTFVYEIIKIQIKCSTEDKMKTKFAEFIQQLNPDTEVDDYKFYYDNRILDPNKTFDNCKNIFGGKKDLIITAIKTLRVLKCPKCNYNGCIITLNDHQISFYGCEHKHTYSAMYDDYFSLQKMNNSKIKCCQPGCNHNQKNDPRDFYLCLTCTKMLENNKSYCYNCNIEHKNAHEHTTEKFEDKNYYCLKHFGRLIEYCFTCKTNLCEKCKDEHKEHTFKKYELLTPSDKDLQQLEYDLKTMNRKIDNLQFVINDLIYKLNGSINIYKGYCIIAKDIIDKYKHFNKDFKNFEILKTLRNLKFTNDLMIKDLDELIESKDSKTQSDKLIDIYMKRKNRYYGDNASNQKLNEEKDTDWIAEIENKEGIKINKEKPKVENNNVEESQKDKNE